MLQGKRNLAHPPAVSADVPPLFQDSRHRHAASRTNSGLKFLRLRSKEGDLQNPGALDLRVLQVALIDRNGWEVIPEKVNGNARMEAIPLKRSYGGGGLNLHVKNHLDCIKKRNPDCNANIEIGAHIAKFAQLGNIAYRTGEKLKWDGTRFTNSKTANKYLTPNYRNTWKLPKV